MAMTMNGEFQLAAPPQTVWEKLNDADTLKACIPGCEQLDKTLRHRIPGHRHRQDRAGQSQVQRQGDAVRSRSAATATKFPARAMAASPASPRAAPRSSSTPKDGGTLLAYDVEAQIGGKLAQLGQRLVNGAAKKVADDFFQNFAAAVNPKS